jgi:hypothetical protein
MRTLKLFIAVLTLSAFLTAGYAQPSASVSSDSMKTITSTTTIKKLDKRLGVTPGKKTNWSKIKDLFL